MSTRVPSVSRESSRRKGAIAVLAAFVLVPAIAFVAFAVDLGYLCVVRAQIQNSADAAALAAAWDLLDERRFEGEYAGVYETVRNTAAEYAGMNFVAGSSPELGTNVQNSLSGDIVIGRLDNPTDLKSSLALVDPARVNTVLVRVQRTQERNGPVPLFFARILGVESAPLTAAAMASVDDRVVGVDGPPRTPSNGVIPFALRKDVFDAAMAGMGPDDLAFDPDTEAVSAGGDSVPEMLIFPDQSNPGGLVPGNYGTVVIGDKNGSTSTLERQILDGLSQEDLNYYPDGEFKLNETTGTMPVGGDTGISAGIEDALLKIVGETRIILLYDAVDGNGAGAIYNVVGFAGIRIMAVDLSGGEKAVAIQPAFVVSDDVIIGEEQSSYFVSKRPTLSR